MPSIKDFIPDYSDTSFTYEGILYKTRLDYHDNIKDIKRAGRLTLESLVFAKHRKKTPKPLTKEVFDNLKDDELIIICSHLYKTVREMLEGKNYTLASTPWLGSSAGGKNNQWVIVPRNSLEAVIARIEHIN